MILSLLYPAVLSVLSYIDVQIVFEDKLIALAVFGVIYGAGIGLPYRIGFSYGGDDTLAKVLKKCVWKSAELKKVYYFEEVLNHLFMATAFNPGRTGLCVCRAADLCKCHELCGV